MLQQATWTTRTWLAALCIALLAGLATPVAAQVTAGLGDAPGDSEVAPPGRDAQGEYGAQAYGNTDVTIDTLQAFAFSSFSGDNASLNASDMGARFCTDGSCVVDAPVDVPSGASIVAIELEACDHDGAAQVGTGLYEIGAGETGVTELAAFTTGAAEAPGCDFFLFILDSPVTVDNFDNSYVVEVAIDGSTEDTRFQAVRVLHQRQVSPAPSTATFDDVPTSDNFHQFVEALAASDITSGCSADRFCPDAPLTRSQMAVFLSKALGLHWPD